MLTIEEITTELKANYSRYIDVTDMKASMFPPMGAIRVEDVDPLNEYPDQSPNFQDVCVEWKIRRLGEVGDTEEEALQKIQESLLTYVKESLTGMTSEDTSILLIRQPLYVHRIEVPYEDRGYYVASIRLCGGYVH